MKKCNKCQIKKDLINFNKQKASADGFCHTCRECRKLLYYDAKKRYPKDYWSEKAKLHYHKNKHNPEWLQRHNESSKKSTKPNYKKLYHQKRLKEDQNYRLKRNLRKRLTSALKLNSKKGSAVRDLGCTIPEFKLYLESLFQPYMTWNNYGKYGWHIDHKRPLASFDLNNKEELIQALHYTNLQPMWAKDNLSKGAKLIY